MKFDGFIQNFIELNLSFVGEFTITIASFLTKFDESLLDIFGKCNQKIANTKINHQKCHENLKNTEKEQQLIGGSEEVGDRRFPIEW